MQIEPFKPDGHFPRNAKGISRKFRVRVKRHLFLFAVHLKDPFQPVTLMWDRALGLDAADMENDLGVAPHIKRVLHRVVPGRDARRQGRERDPHIRRGGKQIRLKVRGERSLQPVPRAKKPWAADEDA